ncbi:MAG: DUF4830 domain-containing protein [Oscillospiraceae bacterium]
MMLLSLKINKAKIAAAVLAAAVGLCAVFGAVSLTKGGDAAPVNGSGLGSTNEQRIEFLKSFGWEVSSEAMEIETVIIPAEFSDVYENYNEIQKQQGYDLSDYKSKEVKRYTYEVKNYPLSDSSLSGTIRANLLVYNGVIIGGDVCSVSLGGFMHGFSAEKQG